MGIGAVFMCYLILFNNDCYKLLLPLEFTIAKYKEELTRIEKFVQA